MRDCPNATMRDLLPELLHGRLPAREAAEVRLHVEGCADCRAELALLTRVRSAMPAPAVDTGRIASSIPPYRASRSRIPRILWQAAAAVLLVAGATLVARTRPRPVDVGDTVLVAQGVRPAPGTVAVAAPVAPGSELDLSDSFQDLSDNDLLALAEAVGALEATLSVEPETTVPIIEIEGA